MRKKLTNNQLFDKIQKAIRKAMLTDGKDKYEYKSEDYLPSEVYQRLVELEFNLKDREAGNFIITTITWPENEVITNNLPKSDVGLLDKLYAMGDNNTAV